jgi:hypothetical protein
MPRVPDPPLTTTPGSLVTLGSYKVLRGITSADRDAQITAAIPAAEQAVIDYIDRDLISPPTVATRVYNYELGQTILNIEDCITITQVSINGRALQEQLEYIEGFTLAEPVISWLEVIPNLALFNPIFDFTHVVHRPFRYPFQQISVTATFGWPADQIPASAKQAAVWLVDEMIVPGAETTGIAAESIADLSEVYIGEQNAQGPPVLPPRVAQILTPLRRISV